MVEAPPICTQPMQGRWTHGLENYKGCGLVEGGKKSISGIQPGPLLGSALLGRHLGPK